MPFDTHTRPADSLAAQLTAKGYVQVDGWWTDPAKPNAPPFKAGGVSAFSAEDWADYDAGRPERCQPDVAARAAARSWRDRDGF